MLDTKPPLGKARSEMLDKCNCIVFDRGVDNLVSPVLERRCQEGPGEERISRTDSPSLVSPLAQLDQVAGVQGVACPGPAAADTINICWCGYTNGVSGKLKSERNSIDLELVEEVKMKSILHWNYRNLNEFPMELLDNGKDIREIYLKRNCITKLPRDVGKLENVTDIYLSGNQLTCLPAEIGQLQKLEVLDVSQNFLKELPEAISKLTRLNRLVLTHNDIHKLPLGMRNLHRLRSLELSDNKLTHLPEEIFKDLKNLEEFCVDRNPIGCLPRTIVYLPKLRTVSVCNCNLKLLPAHPFRFLLQRRSRRRSFSPINLGEESPSEFQFSFDANPDLNYLPFWVLQLLGPHLAAYGSGGCPFPKEIRPLQGFPSTKYELSPSSRCYFYFDNHFTGIHAKAEENILPSLKELCLRSIFENRDVKTDKELEASYYEALPAALAKLLVIGPACQCHWCQRPIFTCIYPLFFKLQVDREPLIVAMFEPHSFINSYNYYEIEDREQSNGNIIKGFHYAYFAFCSPHCKVIFKNIANAPHTPPFHDYKIAVTHEIHPEQVL